MEIPRGKYLGKRVGGEPKNEAEHFFRCKECGGWVDMLDLGAVMDHECPLPHPPGDKRQ
jgi:hypothetical protein